MAKQVKLNLRVHYREDGVDKVWSVAGLVNIGWTQAELDADVRDILAKFIPGAEFVSVEEVP